MSFHVPERFRMEHGPMGTTKEYGNNGCFLVDIGQGRAVFAVASDGMGWEHVSVTVVEEQRCPTWDEMCWVKDLFWDEGDTVIQFHPPKTEHVNNHPYCLHMWRRIGGDIILPPTICVGVKEESTA